MAKTAAIHTTESVLSALGYPNPLDAARQQARMILLGRQAHYRAAIRQLESRSGSSLEELHTHYTAENVEDFLADDDYLEWRWYADALDIVQIQLSAISTQ